MPPKKERQLDWQIKCTSLTQRSDHLLDSGLWADCSFIVGDEEKNIISAHKLILAMASPVFEAMLFGSMAELAEGRPIAITDISTNVFRNLLRYIYTDKVHADSFESLRELIYASKKYMLKGLSKDCIKKLKQYINYSNVCHAYELAKFFEEDEFATHCLQEIFRNTSLVVKHASFVEASLNTIVEIFKQNIMELTSELDLFQAIEYYYHKLLVAENEPQNEASQNEIETGDVKSKDQSESLDEVALKLRPAVKYIRFLRLTPEQFASGPASSPLLTPDEAYSILMNIADPRNSEPIPAGLSDNREARLSPDHYVVHRPCSALVHPSRTSFAEAQLVFNVYNCKTRKRKVSSRQFSFADTVWKIVVDPICSKSTRHMGAWVEYCEGGPRRVHASIRVRAARPGVNDLVQEIDQTVYVGAKLGSSSLLSWNRLVQSGFIGSNSLLVVDVQIAVSELLENPRVAASASSNSASASNATTSNPTPCDPTNDSFDESDSDASTNCPSSRSSISGSSD